MIRSSRSGVGDFPRVWRAVQIRDVAKTVAGGRLGLTKADYVQAGFPAYSASGQDGFVSTSEFEGEAVVVASIGARCGKSFHATGRWSTLANTQAIFPTAIMDAMYLWYVVNDESYWHKSGSAQPFISPKAILDAWLPLPPLPEQKKIAAILSAVDEAIQATQAVIDQTRRVKEGLLQDLLTRGIGHTRFKQTEIGEIPEGWEVRALGDFATIDTGFAFKSSDFVEDTSATPIVRMSNLVSGKLDLSGSARVPSAVLAGLDRFRVRAGDFLMGLSGSLSNYAWVSAENGDCYLNQRVGRIRGADPTSAKFASYWYLSPSTQTRIVGDAAGNAQLNISPKQLASLKLGVPPADERRNIVGTIDALVLAEAQSIVACARLQSMKSGLLTDLLTGKVRVTP